MSIHLTPEQEAFVHDQLKAGRFHSVEQLIAEALRALRDKDTSGASAATSGAEREAVRELLAFAETNRVRLEGVSVKHLIHEDARLKP